MRKSKTNHEAAKNGHVSSQMEENKNMGAFIKELWAFLRIRKKLWVAPIISVMILIVTLLIVAQGSVLAPFIYSLF